MSIDTSESLQRNKWMNNEPIGRRAGFNLRGLGCSRCVRGLDQYGIQVGQDHQQMFAISWASVFALPVLFRYRYGDGHGSGSVDGVTAVMQQSDAVALL